MATSTVELIPPEVIPDDDRLFEIVDGHRLEKTMGAAEVLLMTRIGFFLSQYAETHNQVGQAAVEMLFDLGFADKSKFRPDAAFVSYERWPKDKEVSSENAWPVIPDLAVEVVSPTNTATEIEKKVTKYLSVGVKLVWVVHLSTARIYVYETPATVRLILRDGELDGGDVLPGFRLSLIRLFGAGPN